MDPIGHASDQASKSIGVHIKPTSNEEWNAVIPGLEDLPPLAGQAAVKSQLYGEAQRLRLEYLRLRNQARLELVFWENQQTLMLDRLDIDVEIEERRLDYRAGGHTEADRLDESDSLQQAREIEEGLINEDYLTAIEAVDTRRKEDFARLDQALADVRQK